MRTQTLQIGKAGLVGDTGFQPVINTARMAVPRGFTIVELVVVIVIIAVLSGMTVPQLAGSWGSASLRSAARDLLVTAQFARHYAATHRTRCRLVLHPTDGRYVLEAESDKETAEGGFEPVQSHAAKPGQLPSNVRFETLRILPRAGESRSDPQSSAVFFEPNGQADTAVIAITDGRRFWTLRVAPTTARVELLEGKIMETADDRRDLDR